MLQLAQKRNTMLTADKEWQMLAVRKQLFFILKGDYDNCPPARYYYVVHGGEKGPLY